MTTSTLVVDHVDAVLAKLRTVPGLAVFDDQVPPDAAVPRVIVRTNHHRERPALDGVSRELRMRLWLTCVGETREQAQLAVDAALDALVDARLEVPGRQCDPIVHIDSQPVRLDEAVDPAVFYSVDLLDLVSLPA